MDPIIISIAVLASALVILLLGVICAIRCINKRRSCNLLILRMTENKIQSIRLLERLDCIIAGYGVLPGVASPAAMELFGILVRNHEIEYSPEAFKMLRLDACGKDTVSPERRIRQQSEFLLALQRQIDAFEAEAQRRD